VVAIKANQAEAFLKSPDPKLQAILFFGPDAGLVTERAIRLSRAYAALETPPGEILSLEETDLDDDPGRLSAELQTAPMFGGRRIVRAKSGRRVNAASIKPLLEGGGLAGVLIVEAGNLRADEGLRPVFEKSAVAAAVPCYADSEQDLAQLVSDVMRTNGLKIAPDARDLLVSRLGADRGLSRGELDKLALYVLGRSEVTADDVEAVVGDASDLQLDRIPEAAASGDSARAAVDADRAIAAGDGAQAIILATQRYFLRLHRLRAAIDQGRSVDEAVRGMRPPVPFKAQAVLAQQCRAWSVGRLSAALSEISATVAATRQTGALDETLVERLLLRLAAMSRIKG
jgi:DNA polymerase-3 subunit delta